MFLRPAPERPPRFPAADGLATGILTGRDRFDTPVRTNAVRDASGVAAGFDGSIQLLPVTRRACAATASTGSPAVP